MIAQGERQPLGVYLHIPFCRVHCPYCDFYTYPVSRGRDREFVAALRAEIAMVSRRLDPSQVKVETIYFGGGTPSLLTSGQIDSILTALAQVFTWATAPEITLEANPGEVTAEYLDAVQSLGVNRISLGLQSFDPAALRFLGRDHGVETLQCALDLVAAWDNWSADLIFGYDGQSVEDWERDLDRLSQWRPPHVSLYQLTIEPKTKFGVLAGLGRLATSSEDRQAELYAAACTHLTRSGLEHYEISSFARPGHRSRHNSLYWRRQPYVGFGPAASSFLSERRTENVRSLPAYVSSLVQGRCAVASVEVLSGEEQARERVWLGLRTSDGIPRTWLGNHLDAVVSEALAQRLLVDRENGNIALTERGMALADAVAARFLLTDAE